MTDNAKPEGAELCGDCGEYTHDCQCGANNSVTLDERVTISMRMVNFLSGSADWHGYYFGDARSDRRGAFWWRSELTVDIQPLPTPVTDMGSPFQRGDRVRKVKGLPFGGDGGTVVLCCYQMLDGAWRVVGQHPEGWQHIFEPGQLELVTPAATPVADEGVTEADREAMIAYEALSAVPLAPSFVEEIRAGQHDTMARVQAIQRHRLAHQSADATELAQLRKSLDEARGLLKRCATIVDRNLYRQHEKIEDVPKLVRAFLDRSEGER